MSAKKDRPLEFKTFGFEFKEVSTDGIIRGYASTLDRKSTRLNSSHRL